MKIRQSSEEAWNSILEHSRSLSASTQSLYLEKIKNMGEVTNSLKKTEDLQIYCTGLMKEMLWGEPPITIKLYQLKKDLEEKVAKSIKDNSAIVYQQEMSRAQSIGKPTSKNYFTKRPENDASSIYGGGMTIVEN